jgi:hypothetical protein
VRRFTGNRKSIYFLLRYYFLVAQGWVQGAIQATQMIRCGDAKAVMVIEAQKRS